MSEKDKLQKAVKSTLEAGYQVDIEAFDFLKKLSLNDDPILIMQKALLRISELEEKTTVIDRSLLETLQKQPEKPSHKRNQVDGKTIEEIVEKKVVQSKSVFHPYSKEIDPEIAILEDPTDELTSHGEMRDYIGYFQDRFRRMERLLRKRIDARAATPIAEALKSPARTKLKIIGMITEKREVKQKVILTVEDLHSRAIILVTQKASAELHRKTQLLLRDQVVCLSVVKARGDVFFAQEIIFPEIGLKPQHRSIEPVYAVLTSDIHVGSIKFNQDAFQRFTLWLNGKYGNPRMKEVASHVKYVLVAGDVVDGVGIYPNQIKELVVEDVYDQYKLAAELLESIPDYIEVLLSPGNHDATRKALPQPAISSDFLATLQESRKVYSLGNPCRVSLHQVEVLMFHGRSLDDVISEVPGIDHSQPEKAMKLLLQNRHLAPLYGGKTMLSPEKRDFLVIERVPDIFHGGHIHVLGYCSHRGVLIVNSGGWQEQTEYMQKFGLFPTPGKVPVVNLKTLETTILSFM
ncbi:DNA-directed DNA polymerase II small subunit [Candidatus Bathyarchaeota archaeon]|nr:DNA-directed DNA polymerase II small subunit [Candidatus Bathyarchaeota archaeon]